MYSMYIYFWNFAQTSLKNIRQLHRIYAYWHLSYYKQQTGIQMFVSHSFKWVTTSFSCQKEVGGGGSDIAFWTFLKSVLVQRHELWDKESPHILKRDWDENSRAKYWWMPRDRKMEDYRNKGRKKASPRMSGKEWTNRRLGKAPLTPTCEWILSNGWYGKYWYLVFSKLPPSSTLRTSILLNT